MEIIYPAATFTATRDELLGAASLLGGAEVARGVCRSAEWTTMVLAITPERMRRIDGWLDRVGFVTHPAAAAASRPLVGSVCDRDRAADLVDDIVRSLIGGLPADRAARPVDLVDLGTMSPATLPGGMDWLVVIEGAAANGREAPLRSVLAHAGGLVFTPAAPLFGPFELEPMHPDRARGWWPELVGHAPRSLGDLLDND